MVKHTQTIRRRKPTNCLSVFDHITGLMIRGSTGRIWRNQKLEYGQSFKSFSLINKTCLLNQIITKHKDSFNLVIHIFSWYFTVPTYLWYLWRFATTRTISIKSSEVTKTKQSQEYLRPYVTLNPLKIDLWFSHISRSV